MNAAAGWEAGGAPDPSAEPTPAARRRRRAALARRLQAADPAASAAVAWADLDGAPAWLALPDLELTRLALRTGALRHAPLLRLWIDAPRLAAARAAVGARFFDSLLVLPEAQLPLAPDLTPGAAIGTVDQVAPVFRSAGQAVLLASLPAGSLRRAMTACWAPVEACGMAVELAGMLVARIEALAARAEVGADERASPPSGAAPVDPAPGAST
jgi:hypothetical protein